MKTWFSVFSAVLIAGLIVVVAHRQISAHDEREAKKWDARAEASARFLKYQRQELSEATYRTEPEAIRKAQGELKASLERAKEMAAESPPLRSSPIVTAALHSEIGSADYVLREQVDKAEREAKVAAETKARAAARLNDWRKRIPEHPLAGGTAAPIWVPTFTARYERILQRLDATNTVAIASELDGQARSDVVDMKVILREEKSTTVERAAAQAHLRWVEDKMIPAAQDLRRLGER